MSHELYQINLRIIVGFVLVALAAGPLTPEQLRPLHSCASFQPPLLLPLFLVVAVAFGWPPPELSRVAGPLTPDRFVLPKYKSFLPKYKEFFVKKHIFQ